MTSRVIQCEYCQRYKGASSCEAFKVIPMDIFFSKTLHTSSIAGDNGLLFVEIENSGWPKKHSVRNNNLMV